MARKKKERAAEPLPDFPPEERRAEVATIGWMLCVLFTFCAELVGLIAKVVASYAIEPPFAWTLLADVTHLMALATGTLGLVLTPLVYRLRKTQPPAAITVVAVLVGLTPWATLLLEWLRGV